MDENFNSVKIYLRRCKLNHDEPGDLQSYPSDLAHWIIKFFGNIGVATRNTETKLVHQ
jgi:hypothetical protein